MNQIRDRLTGKIICEGEESIRRLAEKNKTNLNWSNLKGKDLIDGDFNYGNLSYSDLRNTNLSYSDLSHSDLSDSNLSHSNLSHSNLSHSNLSYSDLSNCDLSSCDLSCSNLSYSDLSECYLLGCNLNFSTLRATKIQFYNFPSIRLLSSIYLYNLPDDLTLELMRRDAYAHPHPELFNEWAKGGECPYISEERFWMFERKREIWRKGKPQMTDRELILAICRSQGWKIKNYL